MNTLQSKIILSGLLLATIAFTKAKYEAGVYEIDSMHSKVGFEVPHLVISTVEGTFNQFDGKLELADKFEKSKLDASVDVTSIDTGVVKRDDHLRSKDFFEVSAYPKMTFKSTKISGQPEAFKVVGDLTLKGVTKTTTFEGKYLGTVIDGYKNQKVAFNLKGKINRKDFGLNWGSMVEAGPVVGDEVTIVLKIQAGHPAKADMKLSAESSVDTNVKPK